MLKVIKKLKFLKVSLCKLFLVIVVFMVMEIALVWVQQKNPEGYQVLWWFYFAVSVGTVCIYYAAVLMYPKAPDFIQEKEEYKRPEVKRAINYLIKLCYVVLIVAIGYYLYNTKLPLLHSVLGVVTILSIFVGILTLAMMFSKSKHKIPYKKERLNNLIAFSLFIGSFECLRVLGVDDITLIKCSMPGVFATILLTILVYKKVKDGRFFK